AERDGRGRGRGPARASSMRRAGGRAARTRLERDGVKVAIADRHVVRDVAARPDADGCHAHEYGADQHGIVADLHPAARLDVEGGPCQDPHAVAEHEAGRLLAAEPLERLAALE